MSKHTPGPWRIGRIAKHGCPIRIIAEDRTIALVPEDDTLETRTGRIVEFVSPEGEANARLAAQAPAMAQLLLEMLEMLEPERDPSDRLQWSIVFEPRLRAVLRESGVL
jgi:hypothetical protein